jgi:hypothetical protein
MNQLGNDGGEIRLHRRGGAECAEFLAPGVILASAQDMLDLMSRAGGRALALHRHQIHGDFFRLRTGVAGDILQKVSNYRLRLGIIGDFSAEASPSLRDFIRESNRAGQVRFVPSVDAWLEAESRNRD